MNCTLQLKSEAIVDEVFPGHCEISLEPDSALDQCVRQLGRRLVDDVPASDPRWMQPHGTSTASSLLIHHQLEDKLEAHGLFLNFLKGVNLWNRVSSLVTCIH